MQEHGIHLLEGSGPCPFCTLNLLCKPTPEQVQALAEIIERNDPSDPDVAECLHDGDPVVFENILDGCLPGEIGYYLQNNGLPYSWAWSPCDKMGAFVGGGMELWNPEKGSYTFLTHEEQIVLPLTKAVNPALVQEACDWLGWLEARIDEKGAEHRRSNETSEKKETE
jgi:hypothetical protein